MAKNVFAETQIFALIWSLYPLLELQTPETWGFGRMCNPGRRWEEETNFISTSCSNQPLPLFFIILFLKATLTRSRNTYLGQVFFRPRLSETKRYIPSLDHFSGKNLTEGEKNHFILACTVSHSLACMHRAELHIRKSINFWRVYVCLQFNVLWSGCPALASNFSRGFSAPVLQ